MDINGGGGIGGFGADGLPLGFGMALTMNERAMTRYAGLTEAQKEELIMRAKDANSKEEMERIVNSIAPADEVRDILDDAGRM